MIHKMKNRRTAILSRREQEAESKKQSLRTSPLPVVETNGITNRPVRSIEVSQSPPVGFTAVNLRQTTHVEPDTRPGAPPLPPPPNTVIEASRSGVDDSANQNVALINGQPPQDASPTARSELMKKFLTPAEREAGLTEDTIRRSSLGTIRTTTIQQSSVEKQRSGSVDGISGSDGGKNGPSVAIPGTPASLLPQMKPSPMDRDDGGPFKSEMVRRMDNMWKGDRVIPPCDRCRRLHMDCLKNLTACMGCTKKHAKCSWKEVKADELQGGTGQSTSPEREAGNSSGLDLVPPLSASSTIEISRSGDTSQLPPAEGRGSKSGTDQAKGQATDEEGSRNAGSRKSEPAPVISPPARFDVRPPPLGGSAQDSTTGRVSTVPPLFGGQYSPPKGPQDEEDDDGDRLQALAARVYRTASQSGHRL